MTDQNKLEGNSSQPNQNNANTGHPVSKTLDNQHVESSTSETTVANNHASSAPVSRQQSSGLMAKIKRNLPLFWTIVGVGVAAIVIIPTVTSLQLTHNFNRREITVKKIEYTTAYDDFKKSLTTNVAEINAALFAATGGVDKDDNPLYTVVPNWFIIHNGNGKLLEDVVKEQELGTMIAKNEVKVAIDSEYGTASIDFGFVWNSKLLIASENKETLDLLGNTPTLPKTFAATLSNLQGLGRNADAEELQTFINWERNKNALVSEITHNDKITVGDLVVTYDEDAEAFDIVIPYTVNEGEIIYNNGSLLLKGFTFDETKDPTFKYDVDNILNEIENIANVTDHTSLATLLNGAGKPTVVTAIDGADLITVGTIAVAPADANGFDITIPYTANKDSEIKDGKLVLNDFKIVIEPMPSDNYVETLSTIEGIGAVTTADGLKTLLLANTTTVLNAIDNKQNITVNVNSLTVTVDETDANRLIIAIPYTTKDGFVLAEGLSNPMLMDWEITPALNLK